MIMQPDDPCQAVPIAEGTKDPPGKRMEDETSEKMDSGMDDEMTGTSPDIADLNSDSDDEPVVIKKKNKKHLMIDDDDDDSKDTHGDVDRASRDGESMSDEGEAKSNIKTTNVNGAKKKTISEALSSIMDSDSDNEEDAQSNSSMKVDEKGNASGEESDSLTEVIKKKKANKEAVDSEDEDPKQDASQTKMNIFNSDLFDAEDSDSDTAAPPRDGDSDGSGGRSSDEDNNADDEGFDEDNLDPKLKAKLLKMKGAAKKPRQGKDRKAKPKRDDLMDIHSESQRLVRESQVALPYHQPTPKSLNDFLARATKKQQDYKALRAVREFKKPSVIQHVIANCSPAVLCSSSQPQHSDTVSTPTPSYATPTSDPVTKTQDLKDESTQQDALSKKMDFEGDELPDLDENFHKNDNTVNKMEPTNPEEMNTETVNEVMDVDHDTTSEVTVENVHKDNSCLESPTDLEHADVDSNNDTKQTDSVCVPGELPGDKDHSANDKEETAHSDVTLGMTPKIHVLSSLKNETPKLSGAPDSFIDLDDDGEAEPVYTGRDKLMNRFLEHSKKKQHKHAKDVDISIVEKAAVSDDTTELKLTSITYHVAEEEDNTLQKLDRPGAKLLALKEQLQNKMKVKREDSRQKRQEIYALENEEGFEGGTDTEEERILDNADEMSEKSDTDIEDDQFDAEFGEEEFEEEEEVEEREANPFLDGEAEEDDDDYNPDKDVNAGRADDDDDIEDSEEEEGDTMKLKLDTSDDDADDDLENLSQNVRSSSKKKRKHVRQLTISDDEESNLPPAQATRQEPSTASFKIPTEGVSPKDNLEEDDDLMSPLTKHLTATQTQKPKKTSSLSLPIEDSQDLYGTAAEPFSSSMYPASDVQPSQGLNFLIEDSQSQMLDADGFFKVKSTTKKPSQASLGLKDISSTQDNMAEFMGLCSGQFVESQDDSKKSSCKQLFGNNADSAADATQGGMDELLGLCSGMFPGEATQGKSQGRKRKLEEDEESNTSFTLLSDNEAQMDSDKDELADDENPDEDYDEVDGDIPQKPQQVKKSFRGFRGKITGKMRQEFIEDEAELSGSEAESDEDLDLPEDEDIMEMELGDQDIAMTEDELRNQVGRAHLKETIDADKREILRLQEMYLPDGDLYSEGGGRMRRFRWKNMDDDTQQDMFGGGGSDEDAPEEDADELKWRMERFEREKFLQEEREKDENENANSQFFKLGKKFALKVKDPVKILPERECKKPQAEKKAAPSPAKPALKPANQRKGSFLTRGKEALAKIAERTKSGVNPNATRHSKNFVFQVVSPEKSEAALQSKPVSRPAAHKRPSNLPPAKRQRTKTHESKSSSSIFNLLER
ncbi:claspin-like [Haliotis cracherodii]|uniref:claspin-like n=1 Tax=Haliotis cracherodii TaxID=6455 RepID=UPI0039EB23DF